MDLISTYFSCCRAKISHFNITTARPWETINFSVLLVFISVSFRKFVPTSVQWNSTKLTLLVIQQTFLYTTITHNIKLKTYEDGKYITKKHIYKCDACSHYYICWTYIIKVEFNAHRSGGALIMSRPCKNIQLFLTGLWLGRRTLNMDWIF